MWRKEINPVEIDALQREAVQAVLRELRPILGIRNITFTDKQLRISFKDREYFIVGAIGMSPKAVGMCLADLITTGSCEWEYTEKLLIRKPKKINK